MKNIVLVDIDGTISDPSHRIHHLTGDKKDWDTFYEECDGDQPIQGVIDIVENFMDLGYSIVFCTGRREGVRKKTEDWLHDQYMFLNIVDWKLLMRPDGDFRHDTLVKPELLEKEGIKLENIHCVLEDRNSMVAKWRELGLTCLQVADGDF